MTAASLTQTIPKAFHCVVAKKLFFIVLLLGYTTMYGQKVGVVMSGGAAKGIAHVGVLKALEENEIPIDYVVGTSMGGIIAGCYAAGMSPDQIETIVTSDNFLRWVNGEIETRYTHHHVQPEDTPEFITLSLSLDSALTTRVNSSIAKDVAINFVLVEQMAQAQAISKGNFDSLFVPMRVVAADVFTQSEVVLSKGSISNALRATQTVPFFYTPIRVDGKYLFDGGVYNNFPVDVMQKEFNPDVIIGSNVSSKVFEEYPYKEDDKLINTSMLWMLLDKSDPSSVPQNGVYIQPNLKGYTAVDFAKAKSLIDSGYVQTLRQIDELKSKITSRIQCEDVATKRNQFTNRSYPLVFDEIKFHLFNSKQQHYLKRVFGIHARRPEDLTYTKIKSGYYMLMSEPYFNTIYPNISFNDDRKKFVLELTRRKQKNIEIDFGGVIASRDISTIFMGINFYYFNKYLIHGYTSFYSGNFYRSFVLKTQFHYPALKGIYIEPMAVYNSWDYVENSDLLKETSSTFLKREDIEYSIKTAWALGMKAKGYMQAGGFNNRDNYYNERIFSTTSTLDEIKLSGFKASIGALSGKLNRKQYASAGMAYSLSLNYYSATEKHTPGTSSVRNENYLAKHQWLMLKMRGEQYFNKGWFRPGFLVEAVYSTQPFFINYQGTLINLPGFNPLTDSRTLLLENFRAFSYVAGGVRVVVSLAKNLDFRNEAYLFKPLESPQEDENQQTTITTKLTKVSFVATSGLVFHSPIGPISIMANYYDDKQNQFGVLLHVGFLLFNKTSLE